MIAINEECPSKETLRRFASGQLEAEEFESALRHVDDCPSCQLAIDEVAAQDVESVGAGSASASFELQPDSHCLSAMRHLAGRSSPAKPVGRDDTDEVPTQLGPYRLIEVLGQGGMGLVFLAEHQRLRRRCAVKVLSKQKCDDPAWLERFDREMTSVASLIHPNIVQASDAGTSQGWHYLVMEYLEGLDLGRVASRLGRVPIAESCEIVRQAATALSHVHSSGLIHRDIKPSNLMLCRDGNVKLLDLGLVLPGDDPLVVDERLTTVGHLMGTMSYMSPEQLIDSRDVNEATDVYALGATLFRLLSGRVPHRREGGLGAHVLAMTGAPAPRLDDVCGPENQPLADLVAKMLAKQPSERPTANEVCGEIAKFSENANLKRLIKHAERTPERVSDTTRSPLPAISAMTIQSPPPPTRRPLPWLIAGTIAIATIVLSIVLTLKTETGELVIASDVDNIAVSVRQGDEVVKRLRLKRDSDNRITLEKGSYIVEIEGNVENVELNKDRVTIGGGVEAALRVFDQRAPATAALFQGKPYAYWMDVLQRETDISSLVQSMRAVELLSRGTSSRREAAEATIRLARQYGKNSVSADDPTGEFLQAIEELYFFYMPDPGFEVLIAELAQNNRRSEIVSLHILELYIAGTMPPQVRGDQPETSALLLSHMANGPPEQKQAFDSLVNSLRQVVEGPKRPAQATANRSLMRLALAFDDSKQIPDWLKARVVSTINADQSDVCRLVEEADGDPYEAVARMNHVGRLPNWTRNGELFPLAWELHREGSLKLSPAYAAVMFGKQYAFDRDWKNAAVLLQQVIREFEQAEVLFMPFARDILTRYRRSGAEIHPILAEAMKLEPGLVDYIQTLLEVLASDEDSIELTQPVVLSFREFLLSQSDSLPQDQFLSRVEAAIETLEGKFQASLRKEPYDLMKGMEQAITDRRKIVDVLDWMTDEAINELAGYQLIELSLIEAGTEFAERPEEQFKDTDFDPEKFPLERGLEIGRFIKSHVKSPAGSEETAALQRGVIWMMPQITSAYDDVGTLDRRQTILAAGMLKDPR
ncbi:MAG: serine/threonine-protein kinase, partial [Planctomycetota bacterium]